ncbi:MAG: division/cell wall cluster transcriptional repressor MraZ [Butyribacter sp.]|nr:division/cell wall cluster transcriptional repressor MraZ [bacterium]MDY3855430.1 division/cell wall cluster transcriptional repressor MraZ [Butyribacter sp.]
MFMGQYEHSIDAKGRTIIPVKYRDDLGETFVVTRGLDGCLFLYPQNEWQNFVDKLQQLPSNQNTRKIQRQFLSKAMEVTLDKQGRILIPALLRKEAALEKEIAFVGMMNRVEVWDKTRLMEQESQEDDEALEITMDELDISL